MAGIKPKNTVVLLVKIQLPVIHGDDESPYLGAVRPFRAKVCSNNVTGGGRPSNGFDQPILLEKDELSGIHSSYIVQIFAPCYIEDRVLCWQNDFVIFTKCAFRSADSHLEGYDLIVCQSKINDHGVLEFFEGLCLHGTSRL